MELLKTEKFDDVTEGEMVVVLVDSTIAIAPITAIAKKTFKAYNHQFRLDNGNEWGGSEWHKAHIYRGAANIAVAKAIIKRRKDFDLMKNFDFSRLKPEHQAIVVAVINEHNEQAKKV